jgi:hypothetical protein
MVFYEPVACSNRLVASGKWLVGLLFAAHDEWLAPLYFPTRYSPLTTRFL